jgi:hypothetical protein
MDIVKAGTRVLLSDGEYDVILTLTQDVEDWDGEWVGIDDEDGRLTGVNGHMASDIIVGSAAIAAWYL